MDDRGHLQKMTMPCGYLECECRMYRIKDLLGEEEWARIAELSS
jgi:hypothetical protein